MLKPMSGSANGHRAEPPTSWPGALWMHVMKVFSGAKPEFDPILMLQMYSFRMDFPAYAQVILAGFSPS